MQMGNAPSSSFIIWVGPYARIFCAQDGSSGKVRPVTAATRNGHRCNVISTIRHFCFIYIHIYIYTLVAQ